MITVQRNLRVDTTECQIIEITQKRNCDFLFISNNENKQQQLLRFSNQGWSHRDNFNTTACPLKTWNGSSIRTQHFIVGELFFIWTVLSNQFCHDDLVNGQTEQALMEDGANRHQLSKVLISMTIATWLQSDISCIRAPRACRSDIKDRQHLETMPSQFGLRSTAARSPHSREMTTASSMIRQGNDIIWNDCLLLFHNRFRSSLHLAEARFVPGLR
jgi:nitrogen fixation-related uncharacterized protein